ncbi:hypothetical protein GGU10DRAFT_433163 [Lentinula aff. detonsa]|uniref:Uncharacterized protein n=1 Tax=Lentinula aff. detonsa TaxID=2804958 RepID=A0AA38KB60_9AGAR|nr:hypothetical protein GGU10DRAFT_433163 [Lentinula aff. detonsa]
MHLRSNTFFSTLFVSLLFIASTFAIPISRDSSSVSNPSAKLVDREVVPQSVDAQADASPSSSKSPPSPTKPLEAQVTIYAKPLPEKDETALKAGIENMLSSKPITSFFRTLLVKFFKDTQPKADIRTLKKVNKIPVTAINYNTSVKPWSSETPQYQFEFILTGKPAGPDSVFSTQAGGGWNLMGEIDRASLSNGGKEPTGTLWGKEPDVRLYDKIAWVTKGKGKLRTGWTDRLECWEAEWVALKKKLGFGKNLQTLSRCPGHFLP